MTYPGQRVQVDVKIVPRRCITDPELRLFQYTAISSADFLKRLVKWYARRGICVECVQTNNGFGFTNYEKQLADETSRLSFSFRFACPICLTILQF